jgi:hypothetical protein
MRDIICATTLALATTAEFLWQSRNCRSSCKSRGRGAEHADTAIAAGLQG